jgi:hypothetical protein
MLLHRVKQMLSDILAATIRADEQVGDKTVLAKLHMLELIVIDDHPTGYHPDQFLVQDSNPDGAAKGLRRVDNPRVLELRDLKTRTAAGMQDTFAVPQTPQHLDQKSAITLFRRSDKDLGHSPLSTHCHRDKRDPAKLPKNLDITATGRGKEIRRFAIVTPATARSKSCPYEKCPLRSRLITLLLAESRSDTDCVESTLEYPQKRGGD